MAGPLKIDVDGTSVAVSNPDKVLYPASGFTKLEVVEYYRSIAGVMLPHLHERPLTLHRFPNGVEEPGFYEKNCPKHAPDFVATVDNVLSRKTLRQCTAVNAATLVWMANLASLEIHPGLSVATGMDVPTKLTFDLDPGAPATVVECCRVALTLRDLFAELGLKSFPKTSGSKGLHVDVPLNTTASFDGTKQFANAIAHTLAQHQPDLIVADMTKVLRKGKVFIDWSQNDRSKTTVAPYSLRARERPWVSTPLHWDEVEATAAIDKQDEASDALRFEAAEVLRRISRHGDLHSPVATLQQMFPGTA